MELIPLRKFSEQIDLIPVLRDINNREESIKWAWFHALLSNLQLQGVTTNIPILQHNSCSDDGTIIISIDSETVYKLFPDSPIPYFNKPVTIKIGVEAKRIFTNYRYVNTFKDSRASAFAQRVWYDLKMYRERKFNTSIDIVATCTEFYFAFAYKCKNTKVYHDLIEFYENNNVTKPCKIYETYPEVRKIVKDVVWEPIYMVDDNLKIQDIINKIFMDMLNGGNA